jgi:hypothetical protein
LLIVPQSRDALVAAYVELLRADDPDVLADPVYDFLTALTTADRKGDSSVDHVAGLLVATLILVGHHFQAKAKGPLPILARVLERLADVQPGSPDFVVKDLPGLNASLEKFSAIVIGVRPPLFNKFCALCYNIIKEKSGGETVTGGLMIHVSRQFSAFGSFNAVQLNTKLWGLLPLVFGGRDKQSGITLAHIFSQCLTVPYLHQIPEEKRAELFHAILQSIGPIEIDKRLEAIENLCYMLPTFSDLKRVRVAIFLQELHASSLKLPFTRPILHALKFLAEKDVEFREVAGRTRITNVELIYWTVHGPPFIQAAALDIFQALFKTQTHIQAIDLITEKLPPEDFSPICAKLIDGAKVGTVTESWMEVLCSVAAQMQPQRDRVGEFYTKFFALCMDILADPGHSCHRAALEAIDRVM